MLEIVLATSRFDVGVKLCLHDFHGLEWSDEILGPANKKIKDSHKWRLCVEASINVNEENVNNQC